MMSKNVLYSTFKTHVHLCYLIACKLWWFIPVSHITSHGYQPRKLLCLWSTVVWLAVSPCHMLNQGQGIQIATTHWWVLRGPLSAPGFMSQVHTWFPTRETTHRSFSHNNSSNIYSSKKSLKPKKHKAKAASVIAAAVIGSRTPATTGQHQL